MIVFTTKYRYIDIHKFILFIFRKEILSERISGYILSSKFGNFIKYINNLLNSKTYVHTSKEDAWNADHTLSNIILPILIKYKEVNNNTLIYVHAEDRLPGITDQEAHDSLIDAMIFSFSNYTQDWESQFYSGQSDYYFVETDKEFNKQNLRELKQGPNHTLICDEKARDAYAAKIQLGFDLFGKYFSTLWI